MKNNVVSFPLNELARYRDSARNPMPKIPDDQLKDALAEIERLLENLERSKDKR